MARVEAAEVARVSQPQARRRLLDELPYALAAGVGALPGLAGTATVIAFLADWPDGNGPLQFLAGLVAGVAAWIALSALFCRGFAHVERANPDVYEALHSRFRTLSARVAALPPDADASARAVATDHVGELRKALEARTSHATDGQRWLRGTGYVNLWRHVHRAEEALLSIAIPAQLEHEARADCRRLSAVSFDGSDDLAAELKAAVAAPASERATLLATIVPEARHVLNSYRHDLWDRLLRLRNVLYATFVFTGIVAYAVLGLAVVAPAPRDAVIAGVAFYLVGAVVGLFSELYVTSRRKAGVVEDYGLGIVRLLTIPLLSGIAGVGGVVVTRLAGTATDKVAKLVDVFSLDQYPYGLIVAAIFGLTPGLLLKQLRDDTDEYKDELEKSRPKGGGTPTPQRAA